MVMLVFYFQGIIQELLALLLFEIYKTFVIFKNSLLKTASYYCSF